jgi:hypothetical protein
MTDFDDHNYINLRSGFTSMTKPFPGRHIFIFQGRVTGKQEKDETGTHY